MQNATDSPHEQVIPMSWRSFHRGLVLTALAPAVAGCTRAASSTSAQDRDQARRSSALNSSPSPAPSGTSPPLPHRSNPADPLTKRGLLPLI
jgi:hypothetical protein